MAKLKTRWVVVPRGRMSEIISEAFPDASLERDLKTGRSCNFVKINAAMELSRAEVMQLCEKCIESGICSLSEFTACVYKAFGANSFERVEKKGWDPHYTNLREKSGKLIGVFVKKKKQKFPQELL